MQNVSGGNISVNHTDDGLSAGDDYAPAEQAYVQLPQRQPGSHGAEVDVTDQPPPAQDMLRKILEGLNRI